jgi:hypothetical protein
MKSIHTLLATLLLASTTAFAQNWCGSAEYLKEKLAANQEQAKTLERLEKFTAAYIKNFPQLQQKTTTPIYTIPVVVHILYNDSNSNISDARVAQQIAQMNLDYQMLNSDISILPTAFASLKADYQIQFCLAVRDPDGNATSGIIHKATTVDSFSQSQDNIKFSSTGGDDAWPADQYLNVWTGYIKTKVCYGTFPGGNPLVDGVACYPYWFGNSWTTALHAKRIMTHEVGHWLNLRHIWGDALNCNGDDFVADTPPATAPNSGGCPTFPHYTCSKRTAPDGDLFYNYMDYSWCPVMFTLGQKARSHAVLAAGGPRNVLMSSPACQPVPTECVAPWALRAKNITTTSATVSWGTIAQSSGYTLSWKPTGAASWSGSVSVSAPPYTLTSLTSNTAYTFQVSVLCQDNNTYSSIGTFTTDIVCSNSYESNNTANTATAIAANTRISSQIATSGDVDWFKFSNTSTTPNIKVVLSEPSSYILSLYRPNKNTLIGQAVRTLPTQTAVSVAFNTTTVGTYYIQVSGNGTFSNTACYKLEVQLSANNFFDGEDDNEFVTLEPAGPTVYPNPAGDKATLSYQASGGEQVTISLIDQTGRLCQTWSTISVDGANSRDIDTKGLAAGVYLLRLSTRNGTSNLKLAVVK